MIIFDLGGVLLKEAELNLKKAITPDWNIDDKQQIPRIFNKTFEFANKIFNKDCKRDWIIGNITGKQIVKKIKENIDKHEFNNFFKNIHEKNLIKFGSEIILDPDILTSFTEIFSEGLSFVKKCKENGIKVVVLSNWDPYSFKLTKIQLSDLFNLFDDKDLFIPANIGYTKPDIEAYKFVLQQTNSDTHNTFFVDDSLTNIEGAKKLGIKSILHNGDWQETEIELIKQGLNLHNKSSSIIIKELSKTDINSENIELIQNIFINYFMDLYKNIPSETLGIKNTVKAYLHSIFEKTKEALIYDQIYASLAYINGNIAGFSTFGLLENSNTILLRTLPINLNFKNKEIEIRKAFLNHIREKFPTANKIIIMVRKANSVHISFCLQTGFINYDEIFKISDYVKKTYDSQCYNGYLYDLNSH